MKSKMLLPLLAVVFAIVGAFATSPVVQMGWFDSNGSAAGGGLQDVISIPNDERTCSIEASSFVCKIVVADIHFDAYNSKANAEAGGTTGLLKYD